MIDETRGRGPYETAAIAAAIAWLVSVQQQEQVLRRRMPLADTWSPQLRSWDPTGTWLDLIPTRPPPEPAD